MSLMGTISLPKEPACTSRSARDGMRRALFQLFEVHFDQLLVEFIGVTLFDGQRPLRALSEAGPQTITEGVLDQSRFAIDYLNRSFSAGRDTFSTTSTEVLVDFYDLSFHVWVTPLWR